MMLALLKWCITSVVKLHPTSLHLVPSPVASSSRFLFGIYGLPQHGNILKLTTGKKSLACLLLPRLVTRCCVPIENTSLSCVEIVKLACTVMDPSAAPELRFAQTYTSCIDQPCIRSFFALSTAMGFVVMGADCMPTPDRLPEQHASGLKTPIPTGIALVMERKLTACWYCHCSRPCRDTRKLVHCGKGTSTTISIGKSTSTTISISCTPHSGKGTSTTISIGKSISTTISISCTPHTSEVSTEVRSAGRSSFCADNLRTSLSLVLILLGCKV
jgi:hypothetical protein